MNIDNFKTAVGGGVRNALFRVNGFIGARAVTITQQLFLMHRCSVTSLNIGEALAPFGWKKYQNSYISNF